MYYWEFPEDSRKTRKAFLGKRQEEKEKKTLFYNLVDLGL